MTTAEGNGRNGALLMFLLNGDKLSKVSDALIDGSYMESLPGDSVYS